jgi:hypothetical protein
MIGKASSSNRIFARRHSLLLLSLALWSAAATWAFAASSMERAPGEYDVKAAYLYYFAKFVEWPTRVFITNNSPIIIGIAGDDPFGPILKKAVSSKMVQNRSIMIYHPKTLSDWQSCHIVFINSSEAGRTAPILEAFEGSHALTVCEKEGAARSKCIISFVMEGGRVQFEVDNKKAEKAGIKISSKLMMVSRTPQSDAVKGRD